MEELTKIKNTVTKKNIPSATQRTFNTGDRVRIKNRIKASSIFTKITEDSNRMATVRRTYINKNGEIDKGYILTDNRLATYRLPKNLDIIK